MNNSPKNQKIQNKKKHSQVSMEVVVAIFEEIAIVSAASMTVVQLQRPSLPLASVDRGSNGGFRRREIVAVASVVVAQ